MASIFKIQIKGVDKLIIWFLDPAVIPTVENKLDLKDFYPINVNQGYKSHYNIPITHSLLGFCIHSYLSYDIVNRL